MQRVTPGNHRVPSALEPFISSVTHQDISSPCKLDTSGFVAQRISQDARDAATLDTRCYT